jgi:ribose transport system permease protein
VLTERPRRFARAAPSRARAGRFGRTTTGGLVLLTAATWAVYSALGQGFLSSFNLFTLSQIAAQYAVVGFAQLAVLVLGRMNLAVGSVGVVVVMSTGWLLGPLGVDPLLGIAAGLLLGAAAGVLMGWLELKTGLNSFIVTLATASVLSGAVLILSGGRSVSEVPPGVIWFGAAPLLTPYLSLMVIPAVVIAVALWYLYARTALGWKLLAVGANERAAELSGVRVGRTVLIGFGLSGVLCAVAALMEMSRVAAALPSLGVTWLLTAFIVPVLGGNPLKGGAVSVGGAVVAAVFVASLDSGLVSLDVPAYWQQLTLSVVLLVAVVADAIRRRRTSREGPPPDRTPDGPRPESEPAHVR